MKAGSESRPGALWTTPVVIEPGEYWITATRLLRMNHRASDRIGTIVSNEVRIVVRN